MTSQCGAYALRAGLARLHARIHMRTPTCPGIHMHERTHARASMQTQILIDFPRQQSFVNAPQC